MRERELREMKATSEARVDAVPTIPLARPFNLQLHRKKLSAALPHYQALRTHTPAAAACIFICVNKLHAPHVLALRRVCDMASSHATLLRCADRKSNSRVRPSISLVVRASSMLIDYRLLCLSVARILYPASERLCSDGS